MKRRAARRRSRARGSRPPTQREFAAQVRAAALRRTSAVPADAIAAFDALTTSEQWDLVQEAVATRGHELLLAYPTLIDIMAGYRRRRGSRRDIAVDPTPCVTLLVQRKWARGRRGPAHLRLPARLLAVGDVKGRRILLAAPTDVEDGSVRSGVRAHTRPVDVSWRGETALGVLACALQRSTTGPALFALSCRHVLSLTAAFPNSSPTQLAVRLNDGASEIGLTTGVEGLLRPASRGMSLDAQLLAVTEPQAARAALSGIGVTKIAERGRPPDRFVIMTPQQAITAQFSAVVVDRPVYTIGAHLIAHPVLIESVPAAPTEAGDSGSPVVSEDGSTLLGMLVAGGNGTDATGRLTRLAYFIPASDLFDPKRYTGLLEPETETWTLA